MKEQSMGKALAILSIATMFSKVLSLLYVPLLTRIIGDYGMGIYGQTYEVFVFIYTLTNVGFQSAISKYVSELEAVGNYRDAVKVFKMSRTILLVVGTFFTIVMMIGANAIAKSVESPDMVYALVFLAPTVMITSVLVTYKGYFQGRNQATPIGVATVVEQIVNVGLSLLCATLLMKFTMSFGPDKNSAFGAAGGTVGTSIGALAALIYLIYIYNMYGVEKDVRAKHDPNAQRVSGKRILRTLIKYGVPITLSTGLQNLGNIIDMFTIKNRLIDGAGFDAREATIMYSYLSTRYKTLINVPMVFITTLGAIAMPNISRAYKLKDRKELRNKVSFSLRIVYLIAIPSAFGLSVLAEYVYSYIFPTSNGYLMMTIGAFVLPLMGIVLIQNVILQSVNQFYHVIGILGTSIVVKVIINFTLVGIPEINIYGSIIASMVSFLVCAILNHDRMKNTLKLKIPMWNMIVKPLLASLYMSVGIFIVTFLIGLVVDLTTLSVLVGIPILLVIIAIGGILYLHGVIYLGGLRKQDLEDISPKLLKLMPRFFKRHLR